MSVAVIDAHQHFWQLDRFAYTWPTPDLEAIYRDFMPEDLKPHLDACGVDGTVIVQAHQSVQECRWALSLCRQHDFLKGVVGWVDLKDPDVGQTLDELGANEEFRGVRHVWHDETGDDWILQPEVLRGLREVAKRDLTYDLLVRPAHLVYVPEVARAVPDLRMVVDHIAKPLIAEGTMQPWLQRLTAVAGFEQISCKISGMVTEADWSGWTVADLRPYVERALDLFGIDRLMYGSDWPVCTLAADYQDVHAACLSALGPLSETERAKLLGANATAFYGLEQSGVSNGG